MRTLQNPARDVSLGLGEAEAVAVESGMAIAVLGWNPLELSGNIGHGDLQQPNLKAGFMHVHPKVSR